MVLFIFSGCSTSSLSLNKQDELMLKYSTQELLLTNKIIDSKLLNFKDLFVSIYKLQGKNKRVLFYEDAATSLSFEFNFGGLYSIMYIFDDTQSYNEIYKRNNLQLVQIKLKNNQYLNVMIQSSSTQVYSYVYGFSNAEFLRIAQMIKLKSGDKLGILEHEGVVFDTTSKPLSNWNDLMVYFTPLIIPVRDFARF